MLIELQIDAGPVLYLDAEEFVVGSDPACQVCVKDSRVAKRHAQIQRVGNRWLVQALPPANVYSRSGQAAAKLWLTPAEPILLGPAGPSVNVRSTESPSSLYAASAPGRQAAVINNTSPVAELTPGEMQKTPSTAIGRRRSLHLVAAMATVLGVIAIVLFSRGSSEAPLSTAPSPSGEASSQIATPLQQSTELTEDDGLERNRQAIVERSRGNLAWLAVEPLEGYRFPVGNALAVEQGLILVAGDAMLTLKEFIDSNDPCYAVFDNSPSQFMRITLVSPQQAPAAGGDSSSVDTSNVGILKTASPHASNFTLVSECPVTNEHERLLVVGYHVRTTGKPQPYDASEPPAVKSVIVELADGILVPSEPDTGVRPDGGAAFNSAGQLVGIAYSEQGRLRLLGCADARGLVRSLKTPDESQKVQP